MSTGTKNLVIGVSLLFIPMVYFIGIIAWKVRQDSEIKAEVELGSRIFFISFSSCLYIMSMIIFMLSHLFVKGKFEWLVKSGTAIVSSLVALILYEEILYGNKQWSDWNYWMIVVVSFNYFMFYIIMDKFKKSIKNG